MKSLREKLEARYTYYAERDARREAEDKRMYRIMFTLLGAACCLYFVGYGLLLWLVFRR